MQRVIFYLSLSFILLQVAGYGQALKLPTNETVTVKEGDTTTPYSILIPVSAIPANGTITVSDANGGSADEGKDYDYIAGVKGTKRIVPGSAFITVSFVVYSRKLRRDNIDFEIAFSYDVNGSPKVEKLKIIIQQLNPVDDTPDFPDTTKWSVRLITGANFDFFEAPAFKNFAGDFNVFLPDLFKFPSRPDASKKTSRTYRIGAEFGFFNYRYFEADSSNGKIYNEQYLLDPSVQQVVPGTTKYVNEQYALNGRTAYNTIGMYLKPMIRLNSVKKCTDIYLNLHLEWLTRTQIQTYDRTSIRKDTMVYTSNPPVLQSYPGYRPAYQKKAFNDFYVGTGLNVRANIKGAFLVTFTSTFGMAAFERNRLETSTVNNYKVVTVTPYTAWRPYFLGKAQLITTQAPVDLALGMELRKVTEQPLFIAVYLGVVLSLDKFKR
jgi:hypothetical protein